MDFKQLKTFIAVVDCKSFTKAAEALHISQPTVSAHIQALEEEFATPLLIRTTKYLEITPQGMDLYRCALSMSEQVDRLTLHWTEEYRKTIRLGVSTIPSAYVLPEVLPEFCAEYPDVRFSIHQDDSFNITEGLSDNKYDLGIIGMFHENERTVCTPFYKDRMVLVTPATDEYRNMQKSSTAQTATAILRKSPLIQREGGSGSGKSADRITQSLGLGEDELRIAAHINDTEAIKNLVAAGFGVSVISEKAVENYVREGRVLAFELPKKTSERYLYLIHRKDTPLNSYCEGFIDFLTRKYK